MISVAPAVGQLDTLYFPSPGSSWDDKCCPVEDEWTRSLRTCKRRYCPRCGVAWARAWGTLTRVNLEEYGGPVALISITAPGADVLPWSCSREHRHGGPKGCRVEAEAADQWSKQAPRNWRKLRDAARRAMIRSGVEPPRLLQRVWEPQKRGVPHLHVVVGLATAAERRSAARFVAELHRLAPDNFFGFVDRKLAPISAQDASRYLTSYLLGRGGKSSIRENIADARMPRSLVWMTPLLTRVTKVTMRNLRRARWFLAALHGSCFVYPQVQPEDSFDVAAAAVALERVRIKRAARSSTDPDELVEARARLGFVRAMRVMRECGPYGPLVPAQAAAAA